MKLCYFCKITNKYFLNAMEVSLQIKMNEALYLRNPENSELGKGILKFSIQMINEIGFEAFTFKKLAKEIASTEAGIYRYFENKHRLLVYLTAWYWSWLEYQILFQTIYFLKIGQYQKDLLALMERAFCLLLLVSFL